MTINKTTDGSTLTIALEGRLDTTTAPQLEQEVSDSIGAVSSLVMDFTKLEYISSAGLRVLLSAHKKMAAKNGMIVKNANETVKEVFEVTGFSDILDIQ